MIKKVFRQGLAAAVCAAVALTPALATELRGIGLSSVADSAQLTLDLSDGTTQSLFTLDHPDRVVIDLPHTERLHGLHAPAATGVVTAVRFGSQPHGTLRVVIEHTDEPLRELANRMIRSGQSDILVVVMPGWIDNVYIM